MMERVIRDGIEISKATADFLDEFGLTDEQVAAMDALKQAGSCRNCGGIVLPIDADDFDGLCERCWTEFQDYGDPTDE